MAGASGIAAAQARNRVHERERQIFEVRALSANDGFRFQPMAAEGTKCSVVTGRCQKSKFHWLAFQRRFGSDQ